MKRVNAWLSVLALVIASGLVVCGIAAANPDRSTVSGLTSVSVLGMIGSTGDDAFSTMSLSPVDPSGPPTQHYDPYASGAPAPPTRAHVLERIAQLENVLRQRLRGGHLRPSLHGPDGQ